MTQAKDDETAIDRGYLSKALGAADFARMNAGTLSNRELAAIVEAAKRTHHTLAALEQAANKIDHLYEALEAVNSEFVLSGQVKEIVDAALADIGNDHNI